MPANGIENRIKHNLHKILYYVVYDIKQKDNRNIRKQIQPGGHQEYAHQLWRFLKVICN